MRKVRLQTIWCRDFPTSVYTAAKWGNKILVGGSDWDRRKLLYSKKISEKAKGTVWILDEKGKEEEKITLPSMVYSIVPVSLKSVFVGCKSSEGSLNLLDQSGKIVLQKNDFEGRGVYNSLYLPERKEIFITTRTGKMGIIEASTLKKKIYIQLAPPRTRLWSLAADEKRKLVYTGDYQGGFYKLNYFGQKLLSLDFKKKDCENPLARQGFGPSIWGLEVLHNGFIILGTRWRQIYLVSSEGEILEMVKAVESVTSLAKVDERFFLLGTRFGQLYLFDLEEKKFKKLRENKPVIQKENAIWGITRVDNIFLICVADGIVYCLKSG